MKRSVRIVEITRTLLNNPNKIIPLGEFTEMFNCAKSSISEDISIIKETFDLNKTGLIETVSGVNGGVRYITDISEEEEKIYIDELIKELNDPKRILPGGYFYISDIISNPIYLKKIGRIIASRHKFDEIDYVLTIATKGISLAQAIAYELGVPIVIARKESKITEGSTVSVKYRSQSSPNLVKNMEVGRNSIKANSKVLIVDDFFRGGGSINGLASLVEIFESKTVAAYVLCEYKDKGLVQKIYAKSLIQIESMDMDTGELVLKAGTI